MSAADPETQTAYSSTDWNHYIQSRPAYPESLKDLIYHYRRSQADADPRWERIVDIGGGGGISAALFASDFETVHLVDPSPHNHAKAEPFLRQWIQRHGLDTRLEFTQCTAEAAPEHVPASSADLVICATAAHFIDPDGLMAAVAHILRPGGTLAIYSYMIPIFPQQSQQFSDAFAQAMTVSIGLVLGLTPGDESTRELLAKSGPRVWAGEAHLDSVPVPQELFHHARRVNINGAANKMIRVFRDNWPVAWEPIPSRVTGDETQIYYDSGKDPQAEGWSCPIDKTFAHNFWATLHPPHIQPTDEKCLTRYREWDDLFARECPTGSAIALFPLNLLLATRR